MELVSNWREVLENLITLARYKTSNDPVEAEFYRKLVLRGICFIIHEDEGQVFWGPSRFVGYKRNSITSHMANKSKDGRETNPAINSVMGYAPEPDRGLEDHYKEHCRELGIIPGARGQFGVERKYWLHR